MGVPAGLRRRREARPVYRRPRDDEAGETACRRGQFPGPTSPGAGALAPGRRRRPSGGAPAPAGVLLDVLDHLDAGAGRAAVRPKHVDTPDEIEAQPEAIA